MVLLIEVKELSSKDLIKILKEDGWIHKSTVGSHKQFMHPTKLGKVTIPDPKKDLPIGTINSILKQAGLK